MRTITAFYDSMADAQAAADTLAQAGVDRGSIHIVDQGATGYHTDTVARDRTEEGGFFAALRDLFVPDEDRYSYEEGIRRGGALLSVKAEESQADRVIDALEQTDAVDLDTRASQWRQEGWAGYQAGAAGAGTSAAAASPGLAEARTDFTTEGRTAAADRDWAGERRAGERSEEVIPVVEEQLQVGKREAQRGSVRVRSYVVETPVQESVSLRDEHVRVERRPVDRPLDAATAGDSFRERTLEVTETDEEAVVAKDARVKEELVIGKDVEERTETVSDTVRRTEVEVEDTRGRAGSVSRTGAETTKPPRT